MAKIDSEELIKRIMPLDPWEYGGDTMKWRILKIIKEMAREEKDDKRQGAGRQEEVD